MAKYEYRQVAPEALARLSLQVKNGTFREDDLVAVLQESGVTDPVHLRRATQSILGDLAGAGLIGFSTVHDAWRCLFPSTPLWLIYGDVP